MMTFRPPPAFRQVWLPRIGEEEIQELRRSSVIGLVVNPLTYLLAVASGFAFSSGGPTGIVLGFAAWVAVAVGFATWLRSRMRLADALSRSFGVPLRWYETPRMRPQAFDAWCRRRALRTAGAPQGGMILKWFRSVTRRS